MPKVTSAEILRRARALVAQGWTQGAWARAGNGALRGTGARDAVCWCAASAIGQSAPDDDLQSYSDAVSLFRETISTNDIIGWNDKPERTQATVLATFDEAIAKAERPSPAAITKEIPHAD